MTESAMFVGMCTVVSVGFMKGMSSFTIEYGLSPVMMMTGSVLSCINSVIFLQNV